MKFEDTMDRIKEITNKPREGIDFNEGIKMLSEVLDATFYFFVENGQVLANANSLHHIYTLAYNIVRLPKY